MKTNRRKFSAKQKVQILRQHMVEKVSISEVCEKNGIQPTQFYQWQKVFFKNGAVAFEKSTNKRNGVRSKYYHWRDRYGKVNEHNAWIPRDFWLTDPEISHLKTSWKAEPR